MDGRNNRRKACLTPTEGREEPTWIPESEPEGNQGAMGSMIEETSGIGLLEMVG